MRRRRHAVAAGGDRIRRLRNRGGLLSLARICGGQDPAGGGQPRRYHHHRRLRRTAAGIGGNMSDMRLVVTGAAGRMGRTLVKAICETSGLTLCGALERPGAPTLGEDAGVLAGVGPLGVAIGDDALPLLVNADGIVDFSAPAATVELAA